MCHYWRYCWITLMPELDMVFVERIILEILTGFALKNFQKADVFTYKRWLKVVREFNDSEYVYLLNNKVAFLKLEFNL